LDAAAIGREAMTRTKIIGTLFVPVIALSVFANQLYRQAAYDLSAWKGGGMGMFASADAPAYRFARVIAETGGQTIHLDCFASDLNDLLTSATHEPSERNLSNLARAVLAKTWHLHEAAATPAPSSSTTMVMLPRATARYCPYPPPRGLGNQPLRFDSVRVAFYKLIYDRATNTLSAIQEAAIDHARTGSQ
jgi:hypothetical protein